MCGCLQGVVQQKFAYSQEHDENSHVVLEDVELWLAEYKKFHVSSSSMKLSNACSTVWQPSPLNSLKMNVDVLVSQQGDYIGIGILIQDHHKCVKGVLSKHIFQSVNSRRTKRT